MADSFSMDLNGLKELIKRFDSRQLREELTKITQTKGVVALVAQAIADNFAKEGPGWKPLKPQTIRSSVAKSMKKGLDAGKNIVRKKSGNVKARMILQRTGLLKKSVTTPGAQGNIQKNEGTTLVWGTNLVYAGIHNSGGTVKHPGTKNGFGMGIKIPAHDIPIPKREFLVIREEWKSRLNSYIAIKAMEVLVKYLKGER